MKLAAETAVRLQPQSSARASGRRSLARRAEYSGSSRKTMALIVSDTVKAVADPMMIASRTAIGRMWRHLGTDRDWVGASGAQFTPFRHCHPGRKNVRLGA